jgi:seryl-tRNA synthetase
MKTRARVRDAEALKRRLNDLHAQSNENIAKRKALESQIGEVEQRLQNPEITNQAENEAQLKALFTELNQLTEKEEAIQAQIKAADEEQYGSDMDVDDVDHGLGSDPPDFAQTREVDVPVEDDDENDTPGDYADIKPVDTVDLTGDGEPEGWGPRRRDDPSQAQGQ